MKIPKILTSISIKKYISALLITTILLSQTIHVSFFDSVSAGDDIYHDIVSIIIDADTYRAERNRVHRYATDISGYLGNVRTQIMIVEKGTTPEVIAAKNEKLYYEGDGESGISTLVGTILIGNIPIPMVQKAGQNFPSLYPYVDFVDKAFVFSPKINRYVSSINASRASNESVEIWHGVINPAVGRKWDGAVDIPKIGSFLDKTHDFYTKSGKFTPSTTPPKVFYFDGFNESKSATERSSYQYALSMQNAENIAYNRYSKYLLSDINHALQVFDTSKSDPEMDTLYASIGIPSGSDTLGSGQIAKLPDIQTKTVILSMLKNFNAIFNEKTLGDELLAVHNAGRYTSGATVTADIAPVAITLMDQVARDTLRTSNDAIIDIINTRLRSGIASPLVIFDRKTVLNNGKPPANSDPLVFAPTSKPYTVEYRNYYFGTPGSQITSPSQCTIARGFSGETSTFGRSILTEANSAYDIKTLDGHIELLKNDTEELVKLHQSAAYSCFDATSSVAKTQSYWGGNSVLRVSKDIGQGGSADAFLFEKPSGTSLVGFSLPIFSLGGMKETARLPNPSLSNCIESTYQYSLMQPYVRVFDEVGEGGSQGTCSVGWPDEFNLPSGQCTKSVGTRTPRLTCNTPLVSTTSATLTQSISDYKTTACLAGSIYLNGSKIKSGSNTCMSTNTNGGDSYNPEDLTVYEDRYYHSIPSVWPHISPTPEEIAAAEKNGTTPSLAIDQTRFVEFLTPKGRIARIEYPNFFAIEGDDIISARSWISAQSQKEWKKILDQENTTPLSAERQEINSLVTPGTLPTAPIDWNTYISDEMITQILQARHWLHPDVSEKYKSSITSLLSYSHNFGGKNTMYTPPKIPSRTDAYEIAYLGLPPSMGLDFSGHQSDNIQSSYDTARREIEGANITETPSDDPMSNPAAQCGPPDGVPLTEWPSAIQCWIKSQFPPRILPGACGPKTIGQQDNGNTLPSRAPSETILRSTEATRTFYDKSTLTVRIPRSSMLPGDTITADLSLQKETNNLLVPPNTKAHLEVVSGTASGKKLEATALNSLISIAPSEVPVTEAGAHFIVNSSATAATLTLRGYYLIPLPDGSDLRIDTANFDIQVTPTYYNLGLTGSGGAITSIDATSTSPVSLSVSRSDNAENGTLSLQIWDDVSNTRLVSLTKYDPKTDTLPIDITKKTGVYRAIVRDTTGLSGEMTFVVRAGALTQTRINTISSVLVAGASTIATIRLLDRLGQPISPDLHKMQINVTGGYIIDMDGGKKTSMTLDIMEPQIPITLGSSTAGTLQIQTLIDDTIRGSADIKVYPSAQIVLKRTGEPRVGGDPIPVLVEIQDPSGQKITGLNSVASLELALGGGTFSKNPVTITDGASEPLEYTPGTVSGEQRVDIMIPGVGTSLGTILNIAPGLPMYADHSINGESIRWTLRDRYGNIATTPMTGTLVRNADNNVALNFENGIATTPLQGGYYSLNIPGMSANTISYTDDSGTHTINGINRYVAAISGKNTTLDFAPDYNARYTVLAGGSYLQEGSDILYDTTVGASQSLAVSTVLSSPYSEESLFSVFPDGSYHVGQGSDMVLESGITLMGGYPLLTISESVSQRRVAEILYQMRGATIEACQISSTNTCDTSAKKPTIRLTLPKQTSMTGSVRAGIMTLSNAGNTLMTINTDGSITKDAGVTLSPVESESRGLEMIISDGDTEIGRLSYMTDTRSSVVSGSTEARNTPRIVSSGFTVASIPYTSLTSEITGIQITRAASHRTIDTISTGPNHTENIGAIDGTPGVGWQGNNTMLLSYAAGDTVGQASQFFHTYTLVNLGDPVAHVDHNIPGTEIDGIDRTVGSILTRGTRSSISQVFHRDMNHDGLEDILVLSSDGYIELFLNLAGRMRSRGMIAYIPDIVGSKIAFTDMDHDGYADIIGIDKKGNLVLIDNNERHLVRKDLTKNTNLPSHVSQFRISDMDQDQHDDIVYLTEGGELGILYGTNTTANWTKKILDTTLGVSLSTSSYAVGGAIRSSTTPDLAPDAMTQTPTETGSQSDTTLKAEVFYRYGGSAPSAGTESTATDFDIASFSGDETRSIGATFVKSQYANAYGLSIEKNLSNTTHEMLYTGDHITHTIRIKNTSSKPITGIEYIEILPTFSSAENTSKYTLISGQKSVTRDFEHTGDPVYDAHFYVGDIPAGEMITLSYETTAIPASYGEMLVGDLESHRDIYGDVGFRTSTTCGADMIIYRSGPSARDYTRGTQNYQDPSLPEGMATTLRDTDKNGTPDSVENMSLADRQSAYKNLSNNGFRSNTSLVSLRENSSNNRIDIGFDSRSIAQAETVVKNLLDGLACGFGGGSCMSFPMNWAPFAPGNSPVAFGMPLNPALMTPRGGPTSIPIFSALTTLPTAWGPMPAVWPPVPSGGGGQLGEFAPFSSFVRIYATPTLTLGMGGAICLGSMPSVSGNIPPPGLSPYIKGGNCIVATKPMNSCKGDGSLADGDVGSVSGLGTTSDSWNASSCQMTAGVKNTPAEEATLRENIINYLKSPDTKKLNSIYTGLSQRGSQSLDIGPLVIGGNNNGTGLGGGIEIDSNTRLSDLGSVIKLKNKRVAAFPDFIMGWWAAQSEEFTSSLFGHLPNLTIMLPTDFGQNAQVNGSYTDALTGATEAYKKASMENLITTYNTGKNAYNAKKTPGNLENLMGESTIPVGSTIKQVKGNIAGIKSVYTLLGKLPIIRIRQVTVPINIPWANKSELDRYGAALKQYKNEFENAMKNLCVNAENTKACLDAKASLNAGGLMSSIITNLKRLEEYERFPEKIQKYITWKERYIAQILCNVDTIQGISTRWIKDNGIRFRKWAELYVLVKAIAAGWQPLLDIFNDTRASCSVCRNQRYDLTYWRLKLISIILPSLPVIRFPKWPDIILDLSDIRFGINISMPVFDPRVSPIRFPDVPRFAIGDIQLGLGISGFPTLPPLPPLLDLPDLPSLPRIKLPDLPPPPKLPKISGTFTLAISLLKLYSKMTCYMNKTMLVPEWQVGTVIAERTERQMTLPIDFIHLQLPQFSIPFLKEIRVSSHVNLEMRSEFISEFARAAVRPVNQWKTDLNNLIPPKVGTDVSIPGVRVNEKIQIQSSIQAASGALQAMIENLESGKDIWLDTDEFRSYYLSELRAGGQSALASKLAQEIQKTNLEGRKIEKDLLTYDAHKWDALRTYLNAEYTDTARLQKIIDLISHDHEGTLRELVADETGSHGRTTALLEKFDQIQGELSVSLGSDDVSPFAREHQRLLAALDSIPQSSPSVAGANTAAQAAGYSPNYQGIYIRTPMSNVQTRLFDYIEPITPTTRIQSLDLDHDGDTDYLYILDDVVYIKHSHLKEPPKNTEAVIRTSQISSTDLAPYIPNYFHGEGMTSKNIDLSYTPATSGEREWRVEFFERYLEWDHLRTGDHDDKTSPKSTIDIITNDPLILTPGEFVTSKPVARSLQSVRDPSTFAIEGRRIDVYSGAISLGLSAGRIIYTGDDPVTLSYTNTSTRETGTITLQPHRSYSFSVPLETTLAGDSKFFVIGSEDGSRYTYNEDLIGLPLLSGMRLYSSDTGAMIRDYTHDTLINLGPASTYIIAGVEPSDDMRSISVPYLDGYYSARLHDLDPTHSDRAGVTLLAPQKTNDINPPVIDFPDHIRLPIYSTQEYGIADIATDMNGVRLGIDPDPLTDTNGDGITDNDLSTTGSGFSLSPRGLTIGSYISPGIYQIVLSASDELDNTTSLPVTIEAFSPVPQIESISMSGTIGGTVSSYNPLEPVHFFRVRGSKRPWLLDSNPTITTGGGIFSASGWIESRETISMSYGAGSTGSIDNHGIISVPAGQSVRVLPMNGSNPMELQIIDQSGSLRYTHTFAVPRSTPIIDLNQSPTQSTQTGIIIDTPTLRIERAQSSDPSIPNGVYLIDTEMHPLLALASDGNISLIAPGLSLTYRPQGGYMSIEIFQSGKSLGTITYRIDFFYTVQ